MAIYYAPAKGGTVRGTKAADVFHGGNADVTFIGNGGQDQFYGGYRQSIVDYSWAKGPVNVSLLIFGEYQYTGAAAGWNLLRDIDGLIGSAYGDHLYGGNHPNIIKGMGGNDTIIGGYVADVLSGGNGDDTITGGSGDDQITGDNGADKLAGDAGADIISGGGGNDWVQGGAGAHHMTGGDGTDTLSYENAPGGVRIDRHDLTGHSNTGDAFGDTFSGFEIIYLTGADDYFNGYGGTWTVHAGAGNDQVIGSGGRDTIDGGSGDDRLEGGAQNDTITGGLGGDVMIGGTGRDTFIFESASDSTLGHPDKIQDFSGDKIDLSEIDAVPGGRNDAFTFIGGANFHHRAGELAVHHDVSGAWLVTGDINGDGAPDFAILISSQTPLAASDFTL